MLAHFKLLSMNVESFASRISAYWNASAAKNEGTCEFFLRTDLKAFRHMRHPLNTLCIEVVPSVNKQTDTFEKNNIIAHESSSVGENKRRIG